MYNKEQILAEHRGGKSNRAIADYLHVDKNTVNRVVKRAEEERRRYFEEHPEADGRTIVPYEAAEPKYPERDSRPRKVTPGIVEKIEGYLAENERKRETGRSKQAMCGTDMWRAVNRDLPPEERISVSTVRLLVRTLSDKHAEAYVRQEHEPGFECQFDWCTVRLAIGGKDYEDYQMAVFASPYSGYVYSQFFYKQDTPSFQEAHVRFIAHCGGVFARYVYDNAKVQVKLPKKPGEHKEATDGLLKIANHYDFAYRFCNIRSGHEKGSVEEKLSTLRRRALGEKDAFETLEEANEHLLKACGEMNSEEDSLGRVPAELFAEEKRVLRVKPADFEVSERDTCVVDKYSTITLFHSRYSVQDALVGKTVDVKYTPYKVYAYYEGELVAEHTRSYTPGSWTMDVLHFVNTYKKKPGALASSVAFKQADPRIRKLYMDNYSTSPKEFIEILGVIKEKGLGNVLRAVETLRTLAPGDYSPDKVKEICARMDDEKLRETTGTDKYSEAARESLRLYDEERVRQKKAGRRKDDDGDDE